MKGKYMKYLIDGFPYKVGMIVYYMKESEIGLGLVEEVIIRVTDTDRAEYIIRKINTQHILDNDKRISIPEGNLALDLDTLTPRLIEKMESACKEISEDLFE